MELIYLWINKSDNNVFQEQGFNFSPVHNFKLSYRDDGNYILQDEKTTSSNINIFNDHPISNITAVVGKNGTGKSTLLRYIFQTMMPLHDIPPKPENEEFHNNRVQNKKSIWVFKHSNEIEVLYNFNELIIEDDYIKTEISLQNQSNT